MPLTQERIDAAFKQVEAKLPGTEHEINFRNHLPRYRFLMRLVAGAHGGGRALDAGASPGYVSALCAAAGLDITAADLHPLQQFPPEMGRRRMNLFHELNLPVAAVDLADGALPFRDGAFHTVLFNETLEHLVGTPMPAMRDIARALAPGGRLILTTPNVASLRNRIAFLFGRNVFTPLEVIVNVSHYKCHNREYTLAEALSLLRGAGLRTVRAGRVNLGEPAGSPAHALLRSVYYAATWLWPPGRSMIFVVAEKPE